MNSKKYIELAKKTETQKYAFKSVNGVTARIEHAIMGLVTESGELMDVVKKTKVHGKKFDKVNVIEEMGDLFWYLAILCDALGISFEKVWDINIKKLKTRYPDKYSNRRALNRNISRERKVLERKT